MFAFFEREVLLGRGQEMEGATRTFLYFEETRSCLADRQLLISCCLAFTQNLRSNCLSVAQLLFTVGFLTVAQQILISCLAGVLQVCVLLSEAACLH